MKTKSKIAAALVVVAGATLCLSQSRFTNIDHEATSRAYDEMYRESGPIALGVIVRSNAPNPLADQDVNIKIEGMTADKDEVHFIAGDPKVKWLGSPITGEHAGGPGRGLLDQQQEGDVQIGLREDGVVVWRKRTN